MDADGYIIVDNGSIWANRTGKSVWKTAGRAKNAWNVGRYRMPKFSEQDQAVCRPVRFVDMETGNYFT